MGDFAPRLLRNTHPLNVGSGRVINIYSDDVVVEFNAGGRPNESGSRYYELGGTCLFILGPL